MLSSLINTNFDFVDEKCEKIKYIFGKNYESRKSCHAYVPWLNIKLVGKMKTVGNEIAYTYAFIITVCDSTQIESTKNHFEHLFYSKTTK